MRTTDRYFRTANFYGAAFALARGLELVSIDRDDPRRNQFVFRDAPEREEWLHAYSFAPEGAPEVLVDARKFVTAIKALKEKLYDHRT